MYIKILENDASSCYIQQNLNFGLNSSLSSITSVVVDALLDLKVYLLLMLPTWDMMIKSCSKLWLAMFYIETNVNKIFRNKISTKWWVEFCELQCELSPFREKSGRAENMLQKVCVAQRFLRKHATSTSLQRVWKLRESCIQIFAMCYIFADFYAL